jgi:hypothetical protein
LGDAAHSAGSPFAAFGFRIRGEHDGGLPARGLVLASEGESPTQRPEQKVHNLGMAESKFAVSP